MKKFRVLAAVLAASLASAALSCFGGLTAAGSEAGAVYAPAADKWGQQGNNGWYWMIQDKETGAYEQLPFNTEMGQFSAAAKYEGQRTGQADAMVPAGGKLVFAFSAPSGGNIELTFHAVAAPEGEGQPGRITMEALKNGTEGIKIDGYDASSIEMENDNALRTYKVTTDVKKNTMVMLTFSCPGLHYLYMGAPFPTFSVIYHTVNTETEPDIRPGAVYSPLAEDWGTQGNNGFYWMTEDKVSGAISETPYNAEMGQFSDAAKYEGQRTSQSDAMIPAGAKLVFGFRAPVGGKANFRFGAVAAPESEAQKGRVTMSVSKNGSEGIKLDGYDASSIEMENDNALRTYTFTAEVKKGSMVYISFSCDYLHYLYLGGIFPTFSAFYTEVNDEAEDEYFGKTFAPSVSDWGQQGNNGFYWMSQDKDAKTFAKLPYNIDAGAENQFSNYAAYVDLRAGQNDAVIPANANLAYAFKAPKGGEVFFSFNAVAAPQSDTQKGRVTMSVVNSRGEGININGYGKSSIEMEDDNLMRNYSFTADVKKNTVVYVVFSCEYSHYLYLGAAFPTFSATYRSVNEEEEAEVPMDDEYVGKTFSPAADQWGKQGVNGFYWMYNIKGSNMMAELPFNKESKFPNAYSAGSTHEHLHMNADTTFHTAASAGTVIAYQAPVGGKILVTVRAKGGNPVGTENSKEDMTLKVLKNTTQVYPENGTVTLPRNDKEIGVYSFETTVAAGTRIYVVASCAEARAGAMSMSVTYLGRNGETDSSYADSRLQRVYEVDYSDAAWGKQNNNNWYFKFYDKQSNKLKTLAWSDGDKRFVGVSEDGKYEHLMLSRYGESHTALYGNPALVFRAPYSGRLELVVQSRLGDPVQSNGTAVSVMQNAKVVKDAVKTVGTLESFVLSLDVTKGDQIAVLLDALGSVSFDTTVLRAYTKYTAIDAVQPPDADDSDEDSSPKTAAQTTAAGASLLVLTGAVLAAAGRRKKRLY